MTVVAICAARDMRWILTGRYYAVMAGATGTNDLRVVDRVNRHPDV